MLWKSQGYINCLVTHILSNNVYFQQKKEIYSGLKQLNPLGTTNAPARFARFFFLAMKINTKCSVNFDLSFSCNTSIDPVQFLFFFCILTIKIKCFAF